jgi:hypothetical protein
MHALTAARVITTGGDPAVVALLVALSAALPLDTDIATFPAVVGANMADAALFARLLAAVGARVDERQIFDERGLGAHLSHARVWAQVPRNATWLIFEDDAVLANPAAFVDVLPSLLATPYDLVNLAPNHPPLGHVPSPVHTQLRECARHDPACVVIGTRAYLLTYEGAQKLLVHASPPEVAVDWYVSSVRDYLDASFAIAFLPQPLFGISGRASTIGHHCLLCKLPRDEARFVCVTVLCAVLLFTAGFALRDILGPFPRQPFPWQTDARRPDADPTETTYTVDAKAV